MSLCLRSRRTVKFELTAKRINMFRKFYFNKHFCYSITSLCSRIWRIEKKPCFIKGRQIVNVNELNEIATSSCTLSLCSRPCKISQEQSLNFCPLMISMRIVTKRWCDTHNVYETLKSVVSGSDFFMFFLFAGLQVKFRLKRQL